MADPVLKKRFPERDLNQAFAMASMCLQEEAGARPYMSDVVTALGFLSVEVTLPPIPAPQVNPQPAETSSQSSSHQQGGKSRSRSSSSVVLRSDESSVYGSDDEDIIIQHPRDLSSFQYENSAEWAHAGSIDGEQANIRRRKTWLGS